MVFGLIYFLIYKTSPKHFLFNNEISQFQVYEDSIEMLSKLQRLNAEIYRREIAITEFKTIDHQNWESTESLENVNSSTVSGQYEKRRFQCKGKSHLLILEEITSEIQDLRVDNNVTIPTKLIRFSMIRNNDQELIFHVNSDLTRYEKDLSLELSTIKNYINDLELDFKDRIESNQIVINNLETSSLDGPSWNFIDFAYFSLVSLPIGTYGDVLPNSTTVRFLIIMQTLINLYILIYLINRKL